MGISYRKDVFGGSQERGGMMDFKKNILERYIL